MYIAKYGIYYRIEVFFDILTIVKKMENLICWIQIKNIEIMAI